MCSRWFRPPRPLQGVFDPNKTRRTRPGEVNIKPNEWAWRWPRMKMLGWEKMIRRIVRVWIQLFFYRAHRSSTSNSTSSSSDSYTSTHFIAMREPQRRFQAFFVGKANYFFTRTIFFVDSLAPYVHFHKENGFPFTRKPWVGTGFLGVSNSSTYSITVRVPKSKFSEILRNTT